MKKLIAIFLILCSVETAHACKLTAFGQSYYVISAALDHILARRDLAAFRVENIDATNDLWITLRANAECKQFQFVLGSIEPDCKIHFRLITESACIF